MQGQTTNTGTSQLPGAGFWAGFTVQEDFDYDEEDAGSFAEACAAELACCVCAVMIFEAALVEGRNPLTGSARAYTPKQLDAIREEAEDARQLLAAMLEECGKAFGDEDAARLYEYVLRERDAAFKEAANEPGQLTFIF